MFIKFTYYCRRCLHTWFNIIHFFKNVMHLRKSHFNFMQLLNNWNWFHTIPTFSFSHFVKRLRFIYFHVSPLLFFSMRTRQWNFSHPGTSTIDKSERVKCHQIPSGVKKRCVKNKTLYTCPSQRIDFWTLFFEPVSRYSSHGLVICITFFYRVMFSKNKRKIYAITVFISNDTEQANF